PRTAGPLCGRSPVLSYPSPPLRTRGGCSYSEISVCLAHSVGAPPSVRLGRAGNFGAAGGYSHPGRVLLQRISVCLAHSVGAPPSVRLGRAGNFGAAGGYSHPGRVLLQRNIRLPCALRRSTALGAIGACRQLRRRRRVFAPGAGAPTGWGGRFNCRSTALGAIGRAGNYGAAGGYSHPGRVLLRERRMGRSLQDLEQFDVEDQGAVRRDAAGGAPAVGQIRGNVEAPFGTFLHQLQCFGPAGDNAAYRELGGLAALVGAVKYLT